jgi:CP family cyanate transporter-like MFS transporter
MVGGALGNVLLPSLVKRYFPDSDRPDGRRLQHRHVGRRDRRRGLDRADRRGGGAGGWRWALGVWAEFALLAAVPWLFVRANPGASRGTHTAVRLHALWHSRMALALMVFFGSRASRPTSSSAGRRVPPRRRPDGGAAGLLLGLNQVVGIPLSAVVPR